MQNDKTKTKTALTEKSNQSVLFPYPVSSKTRRKFPEVKLVCIEAVEPVEGDFINLWIDVESCVQPERILTVPDHHVVGILPCVKIQSHLKTKSRLQRREFQCETLRAYLCANQ